MAEDEETATAGHIAAAQLMLIGTMMDDPAAYRSDISSDTITISRGEEGTSAANHNTGGKTYSVVLGITAAMIAAIAAQDGKRRSGRE